MVDGGIDNITIPYNIIGDVKLHRLAQLASRAKVRVTVDHADVLPGLQRAGAAYGVSIGVLVECDTGAGRAGVQRPEDAVDLLLRAADTGLDPQGVLTFKGGVERHPR